MQVRIYQPAKTAMSSGRAKTQAWILEYEIETPRRPEPLMGWTSSGDTLNQVKLSFPTREDAVAFTDALLHAFLHVAGLFKGDFQRRLREGADVEGGHEFL